MSRRSFPRIDPASLRDHADEERVERVWDRVEHDLVSRVDRWGAHGFEAARARRSSLVYVAIAAAFGAFGVGLWAGKATWDKRAPSAEATIATPVNERSRVEVLAAGSKLRTFPLEGGAQLTLSPGATVEVERSGGAVTIALLQGEASINNTVAPKSALAIRAGEARLDAQAGSAVSVTRNPDDVDVRVDTGSVSVTSPAGTIRQLGKDDHVQVPLRTVVSSAPISASPRRAPALSPRRLKGSPAAPKGTAPPEWLVKHIAGDDDSALALLKEQGVTEAINAARSAAEVQAIVDVMRRRGNDPSAESLAYKRIVEVFPRDQLAPLAADQLAKMYEGHNAELAKKYREQASTLAQNAPAGADALFCNVILHNPNKDEAARMAKEYLVDHPDADCRSTLEQLLAPGDAPAPSVEPAPAPAPSSSAAP